MPATIKTRQECEVKLKCSMIKW
uniref:Uncharacterized protein n=1 Tax=Arundo donax TaxID=35708 RepID=A0A0A9HJD9_ARUDO